MAYLKVLYTHGGKHYEEVLTDLFKEEAVVYQRGCDLSPWFMNVGMIADIIAERHNSRYHDPAVEGSRPTHGFDLTIISTKLG